MPAPITEEQRAVLRTLQNVLRLFGDANDAEDHDFPEAAEEERRNATVAIGEMIVCNDFLLELLPTLQKELDSRHIETFGWGDLYESIKTYLDSDQI